MTPDKRVEEMTTITCKNGDGYTEITQVCVKGKFINLSKPVKVETSGAEPVYEKEGLRVTED